MSNMFKINKEEIVNILSQQPGVKAIRIGGIPNEVPNEYEGSIKVLYEFQIKEDPSILKKSIELKNKLKDLLTDSNLDLYISVRVIDDPRLFYGDKYEMKGSPHVIEVK